jgi:hypothetical protein
VDEKRFSSDQVEKEQHNQGYKTFGGGLKVGEPVCNNENINEMMTRQLLVTSFCQKQARR